MQTTLLIIIIVLLVLCVLYLYGLNYLNKEIHEAELELKDLEIEHLMAYKKFHEDLFFKMEANKEKENYGKEPCDNCNNNICCCAIRKQEILEEASQRAVKSGLFKDETLFIAGVKWKQRQHKIDTDDAYSEGFENGKQLQDKKFYSEEEVLEHLNRLITMPSSELDKFTNKTGLVTMKWFEKFSKLKKL